MLAIGAALAYVFVPGDAPLAIPSVWGERVALWEEQIRRGGGDAAYESFAHAVEDMSYAQRHEQAHAFGAALFKVEGTDGIAVCDDRFSFGCFHQFLGDAIHTLGLGSVIELNARCFDALEKSPLSCQHGVGHGVLSALGYDDDALQKALDTCAALPGTDPIGGCYGGVFMEYNVRTMLADEATAREYRGNPFAPCDTLGGAFTIACMYWQPQWWMQTSVAGKTVREQFRAMGDYCRTFSKTNELERSCFEGLGNVVSMAADFNPDEARTLCEAAAKTARERLLCLSIAANHFGLDVSRDAAESVCEGLPDGEHTYCLAYARNEMNIANVGTLPL